MIRAGWQGEGECDNLLGIDIPTGHHADKRAQRSFI